MVRLLSFRGHSDTFKMVVLNDLIVCLLSEYHNNKENEKNIAS